MKTTNYLQVALVPGKWYVSERIGASETRWKIFGAGESPPKRLPSEMILAGPFDSRSLAVIWNNQAHASGYIWEKEVVGEPKPVKK